MCVSRLRSVLATLSVFGVFHAACVPRPLEQASSSALACANLDLLIVNNNTESNVRVYLAMKLVDEVPATAARTLVIRPSKEVEVRYRTVLVRPEGSSTSRVGDVGQAIDPPTSIFDNRPVLFAYGGTTRIGGQAIEPAPDYTSSGIVVRPGDPAGPICQSTLTFPRSVK